MTTTTITTVITTTPATGAATATKALAHDDIPPEWWAAPELSGDLEAVLRDVNLARDAAIDADARALMTEALLRLISLRAAVRDEPELSVDVEQSALAELIDEGLGRPSRRLVVYGTLAPGEENHHVIEPAGGTWRTVDIEGVMGSWGRYPVFEWVTPGEMLPAMLIESATLSRYWKRLDEFETDHYARHLVPYSDGGSIGVTNCYVRAPIR
jgi:gamma-glutamylcyclotransferase (GGCT)/AIG2-like uncharacterized protein YtfP